MGIQQRIKSIDLLRGLVMIIMALDHVRDYFHADAFLYRPNDLTKASAALFLTRWITNFCAPVFIFLSGTSAFLVGLRKGKKALSIFLLTRGLWLIFLELIVSNFLLSFNFELPFILLLVLWAFGASMIVLAALIHLPKPLLIAIGVLLVFGHNLLDGVTVAGNNFKSFGWSLLHSVGGFTWGPRMVIVSYPLLPWLGIMILGYCFGNFYTPEFNPQQRKRILIGLGVTAMLLFVVVRFINSYGDLIPWTQQKNALFTFFSFINTFKYPPSLLFILMTLGPAMIFLAFTENANNKVSQIISVYGRVPLFYYLTHFFLLHLFAMIAAQLTGFGWYAMVLDQPVTSEPKLNGYGFSLGITYLVWITVVVVLYPFCKRYDTYKQSHKEKWWLSYL